MDKRDSNFIKYPIYLKRIAHFSINTFIAITRVFAEGFYHSIKKDGVDSSSKIIKLWGLRNLFSIELDSYHEDKSIFDQDFGNVLYFANHKSNFDIIVISATSSRKIRFVAKKSLFKVPYFGQVLKYTGMFSIDRENLPSAIKTLSNAAERLKGGDLSVVVFPEGTRSKDGKLLPFKKGPFYLAIDSGVPIIPVTINGTENIMLSKSWKINRGKVSVIYGKPIETNNLTDDDIPELMIKVKEAIEKNLKN